MSTDQLRASVVLDVYAETDGYAETYGVTLETVGRHPHGPLVKFTGTRGDLARMVAECWQLRLSFEHGEPTLTDLEGIEYDQTGAIVSVPYHPTTNPERITR